MKKIIHIDIDYFFAQVEVLRNPELKNDPVAIAYKGKRSVLCTCNYIARDYGVKSAMPLSLALKKCPKLKVINPRFDLYKSYSDSFFSILEKFSSIVEKVSVDEAYIDVSDCEDANVLAQNLKNEVYENLGLTVSLGVSYNKLLAKIGSELYKPNGIALIRPDNIEEKIANFPVGKIQGVGEKCREKLHDLEIKTFGDLQQQSKLFLINHFGSFGEKLFLYSRGIDNRCLNTKRVRKSLSVERTFEEDIYYGDELLKFVENCFEELKNRIKQRNFSYQTAFIKIKYEDFKIENKEFKVTNLLKENFLIALGQFNTTKKIRLVGLGVRAKIAKNSEYQLILPFENKDYPIEP